MPMSSTMAMSGSMPTSSSAMNMSMSGMDMTNGMMSMGDMMMVFFTSTKTPLYSEAWTPNTSGQYVGTCIFLIVLAAIFRGIIAVRANFEAILTAWTYRRDTSLLRAEPEDAEAKWKILATPKRPWSINEALARAILDTILAGVSYLL